jgi:arylsulfatase A-like enzyme
MGMPPSSLSELDVENVLLVTVDCLRADDFWEAIESGSVETMGALASDAISFSKAFTVANTTDPSLTSVMTSQHPQTHGVRENGWGVGEDVPLLSGELAAAGQDTFGVVSVDHLSHEHSGLGRGFDSYRNDDSYDTLYPYLSRIFDTKAFNVTFGAIKDIGTRRYNVKTILRDLGLIRLHCRSGHSMNEDALEELAGLDGPFFGWLHYFDMHEPRNFSRSDLGAHDEYTASMRTVDSCLATVLEELESRGLREETLVVLTGDHGENLDDHGYTGHGRTLYDEEIHVPLLFSHPSLDGPSVDAQVRTIDIAPTILEIFDVTIPDSFDGQSLAGDPAAIEDRPVFTTAYPEFTEAVAIRWDGWKLIHEDGTYELYDLEADPDETRNLRDDADNADVLSHLRDRLEEWETTAEAPEDPTRDVDDETRAMLEDLGYVD